MVKINKQVLNFFVIFKLNIRLSDMNYDVKRKMFYKKYSPAAKYIVR